MASHDGYKSQPRVNGRFVAKAKPALTEAQEEAVVAILNRYLNKGGIKVAFDDQADALLRRMIRQEYLQRCVDGFVELFGYFNPHAMFNFE